MRKVSILVGFFGILGLASCAEKAIERDLQVKVSQESKVNTSAELQVEAKDLIEESNLSAQKKFELRTLQKETAKSMEDFRNESMRLRAVLIKDVFSPNYNRAEVRLIQSKMKAIETKRLNSLFQTIDKANGIFGRQTEAQASEKIMDRMIFNHDQL